MSKNMYTCIVCPNSCRISVEIENGEQKIIGNQCERGRQFAFQEHTKPMRMFTSTVILKDACLPRLSVMTSGEVPKDQLMKCQEKAMEIVAYAPVKCGDIIEKNFCNLNVDLMATRTFDKR